MGGLDRILPRSLNATNFTTPTPLVCRTVPSRYLCSSKVEFRGRGDGLLWCCPCYNQPSGERGNEEQRVPLYYENLDARTRQFMLEEVELDTTEGFLYISPRLNQAGRREYERRMREAISEHDDAWLATELRYGDYFNPTEQRQTKRGITTAKVPSNAPDTLAEGEFNRFYIRGVCKVALEDSIPEVEVYRGRESSRPRPESEALIGSRLPADALLEDLRQSVGGSALIPPGPNSGVTVRLP